MMKKFMMKFHNVWERICDEICFLEVIQEAKELENAPQEVPRHLFVATCANCVERFCAYALDAREALVALRIRHDFIKQYGEGSEFIALIWSGYGEPFQRQDRQDCEEFEPAKKPFTI